MKMRGLTDSYMLVLADGVLMNDAGGGVGNLIARLDPYLIGKVEILRGTQSSLYGSSAVRGVISITTKAKLLNEKWLENPKNYGYKGAGGVSSRVNNLYKWSATTRKVDKWVFDDVVETYILNEENLEWLRTSNPYALEELTRRLLEAESRGLWEADPDLIEAARQAALEIEGDMEEIMGEVKEEFQGGKVDVLTAADLDVWKQKWKLEDLRQ